MAKGNNSSKAAKDNRSNQMNPNNSAYYSSRGTSKPADASPHSEKKGKR